MHTVKKSLIAALALTAALGTAGVAHAGPDAPAVPSSKLQPGPGHKVFLVGHATGVQIYSCNGTAWSFVAPRADLVGDNGKLLIKHYGGPTWEANDGSWVKAARVDGVDVDPAAIPWLLLRATSTSKGGPLSLTTYIQRVNTTGGLMPPAGECTAADAGEVREVAYTSDYYFWKKTGGA